MGPDDREVPAPNRPLIANLGAVGEAAERRTARIGTRFAERVLGLHEERLRGISASAGRAAQRGFAGWRLRWAASRAVRGLRP